MSQVEKSASALERAFLAILVLELEAMVVRLVRPLKLAGVHGDRWTVRLVFQWTSGVPLGACGNFARLGIIAFVERFELEIGLDVTEVGAGRVNDNRRHK